MDYLRKWHSTRNLPTPGMKLRIRLESGEVIDGIRPQYIRSRKERDLGYETMDGEKITNPVEWAVK